MLTKKQLYNKQYYQKNKDKILQYNKQYKETHKEQCKQYRKNYYEAHKEQIKQYKKQYNNTHKEQIKLYHDKYNKQYRKDNKEKLIKLVYKSRYKTIDSYNNFLKYQRNYYNITKQIKRKYRIVKDYNVKTVIITNDNTFKGLFDKQGYECGKKYLDQIFTKKQIELLLQGLIDYLLVI